MSALWTTRTEDAVSLTHEDHHGVGTWLTIINGLKLWIYWPDITHQERDDIRKIGMRWLGQNPK